MMIDEKRIAEALGYKYDKVEVVRPVRRRVVRQRDVYVEDNFEDNTINTFRRNNYNPNVEQNVFSQRRQPGMEEQVFSQVRNNATQDFDDQLIKDVKGKFMGTGTASNDPLYDAFQKAKNKQQEPIQAPKGGGLTGVSPLLIAGIILFAGQYFVPNNLKFIGMIGMLLIALGVFGAVIPQAKKDEMKEKIKKLFKKNEKPK